VPVNPIALKLFEGGKECANTDLLGVVKAFEDVGDVLRKKDNRVRISL
jgi:hypothetical protein